MHAQIRAAGALAVSLLIVMVLGAGALSPAPAAAAAEPPDPDPATDLLPGAASAALAALNSGTRNEALARRRLADLVAERSSAEPVELDGIWAHTPDQRLVAVYSALSQVGIPYRSMAMEPGRGFDCSGLTTWAWAQAGVAIPHSSKAQINGAAARQPDTVLPGDLVWNPGHVVMFLGHGTAIVEAPYSGRHVRVVDWKTKGTLRFGDPLG